MNFLRNLTIRTRAFFLVAIGLFSIFTIQTMQRMSTLEATTRMILDERLVLARTVAQNLDRDLEQILARLEHFAANSNINLMDGNLEPEKEVLQIVHDPNLDEYTFVLDRDGKVLLTEPYLPEVIGQKMDCPHVLKTLQTGHPDIACIAHALTSLSPVIAPVVPIYDSHGKVVGVLGAAINPASPAFSNMLQQAIYGHSGYAQLVDENGYVLAHTQGQKLFQRSDHADLFIPLIQKKQTLMDIRQVTGNGEPFREVVAFAPLSAAAWGVAIEQSEAELLAPINKARRQTLYLSIASILAAFLVIWSSADSIIKPIRELLAASQRFATGDLTTPLEITGKDEIAELGRGFEGMRKRLASWSGEMESAVQKRTRELSEYKNILDSLQEQVMVIDHDYLITDVNLPLLQLTGFQRADVIGKHCYEVSHHSSIPCWQREDGEHKCPTFEIWQNARSARAVHLHYSANGKPAWMDLVASPLLDSHGNVTAVIEACREVTTEKRHAALLTSILELSTQLATMHNESALLEMLVTRGKTLTESATFTVMLIDEAKEDAYMLAHSGLPLDTPKEVRVPMKLPVIRNFMETGKPLIAPDIDRDAPELRTVLIREDIQAFFAYPMIRKGHPIGFITLSSLTSYEPSKEEITAYQLLAERAGAALENARLYEDVRGLSIATIRSLAAAIDARDPYTRGHSEEVAQMAVQMGRKLGWNSADLEMLEFAGLLHDVGKIAVPDAILRKTDPLTPDDWNIIHTHPYHSAQILKPVESMHHIIPWIYHHHEFWDGTGYPDGLKGETIPPASRILAVADCYNAMITDRPYRNALSHADAIAELQRGAGVQFDARIVDVALSVLCN